MKGDEIAERLLALDERPATRCANDDGLGRAREAAEAAYTEGSFSLDFNDRK